MTEFAARGFPAFLAVFRLFHDAGVAVASQGGNRGMVPDDTDPALLAAAAGIDGVQVYTTQPAPLPEPAAARATRRTRKTTAQTGE